jgi:hypothetical protein
LVAWLDIDLGRAAIVDALILFVEVAICSELSASIKPGIE